MTLEQGDDKKLCLFKQQDTRRKTNKDDETSYFKIVMTRVGSGFLQALRPSAFNLKPLQLLVNLILMILCIYRKRLNRIPTFVTHRIHLNDETVEEMMSY